MIKGVGQSREWGGVLSSQGGPTFPGAKNSSIALNFQVRSLKIKIIKREGTTLNDKIQLLATEKESGISSGPQSSGPVVRISSRHEEGVSLPLLGKNDQPHGLAEYLWKTVQAEILDTSIYDGVDIERTSTFMQRPCFLFL